MGLIRQLTEKRDFTETEIGITNYIFQNPDEIASLSIAELARRTYSSNAAIIRLCRKVGTSGYKEFRIAFATELEKHRYEKHDIDVDAPFKPKEDAASIMRGVSLISKEALDTCYAAISPQMLEQTARWLREASSIYIYAAGDTYISALAFSNMLVKIGLHSIMANQFNESVAISCGASKQDVALIISYSGNLLHAMKKELKVLRRNGCRCILISSLPKGDELPYHISFPHIEQSVGRVAGFYSHTCIQYILDCLYGIIYTSDLEKNKERKTRADELANS